MQEVVPDDVGFNGLTDDHSLKRSFKADDRKAEQTVISALQNCLMNVKTWMDKQRLKMNDRKTGVHHVWSQETTGQMQNN